MLHSFSRTQLLLGDKSLKKLKQSTVSIFGIGGVGTFAVEGLARSGVGSFILVDDDTVCITNINRQIHANMNTIGKFKVEIMRDRILEINPQAKVMIYKEPYNNETASKLIHSHTHYIVDAIDSITSKIHLIIKAKDMGIPIISSMGAGNKLDPTKFEVADIYETSVDPLAKIIRRELRQRNVHSLKVVYSKEQPLKIALTQDTSSSFDKYNSNNSNKTRKQNIGSVAWVPSVAGMIIAGEVVKDLINF